MSSANFSAKSKCRVRISVRNPIFRCPPLRCPPEHLPTEDCYLHPGREEKSVHNHHRKKIFWRTILASKKNFPCRWWIQKPYKNPGKPYPPPKSFLCGPHFFLQRKVLHCSRAVYGFIFPTPHPGLERTFLPRTQEDLV